jgi:NADH:ubiquinone oxidoreductase subunit E
MASIEEQLFSAVESQPGSDIVGDILERRGKDPANVIGIMQDIQHEFGYLPQRELRSISSELDIPLSRIYAIATFYKAFRLIPKGRHEIKLCLGTACHVRGAEYIKDSIERELGIEVGGTTSDRRFSFETVRCIGACGLAPVMNVNEEVEGKLAPSSIAKVLDKYK